MLVAIGLFSAIGGTSGCNFARDRCARYLKLLNEELARVQKPITLVK